jgi:FKBP-type peptidyl-prolyl cis-trans isomerase
MQMIRMLTKGDSVTCAITAEDLFKNYAKSPLPIGLDPARIINYNISISEVMNKDQFDAYRTRINEVYAKKMEADEAVHAAEQLAKDLKIIDEYLASKSIKAITLANGIRYVITQEGTGPKADSGQVAMVNYTGYLLDGTHFDTSIKSIAQEKGLYDPVREASYPYAPMEVTVGSTPVIKGWHEALKQMSVGMKATFYIPSTLAYGSQSRSEVIGADTILVFDMELVDLKNETLDESNDEVQDSTEFEAEDSEGQ